ncbi:MAG: Ribosomal small subunit methyltransferase [Planctomycetota bacterium]|jgi:16S rRNA (guanine527-N7)-methyltransferase
MNDSVAPLDPHHHEPEDPARHLLELAQAIGVTVTPQQASALAQYLLLVRDWNQKLNLTRHTAWNVFVHRDLLDSVRLAEHLPVGSRVLDVGSGGGVPGIPLAILRPDLSVTVCDSVAKKAAALRDIVQTLQLPVSVLGNRVQDILLNREFDCLTVRAVAALDKLLPWFDRVWDSGGEVLLIKGPAWKTELEEARRLGRTRGRRVDRIAAWRCPGRDGDSVLLRVR